MTEGPTRALLRLPAWLADRLEPAADRVTRRSFALALLAILALGVVIRLFWLIRVGWDLEALQVHGATLLTSPDGYWFATGAGELLTGQWQGHPRIPLPQDHAIVALTWLLTAVLPLSLEEVALYLPAVLGPLIAIPVAGIGRELGASLAGLTAAALAVCAPIYATRTAAGYFDTDPLAVLVPLMVAWYLIRYLRRARGRDALAAALWLAAFPFAYAPGTAVGFALAAVGCLMIALEHRHLGAAAAASGEQPGEGTSQVLQALAVIAVSQAPTPWPLRILIVVVAYLALPHALRSIRRLRRPRLVLGVAAAGLLLVAFFGLRLWEVIPARIEAAVGRTSLQGTGAEVGAPIFGDTIQFVAEAQQASFAALAERLTGGIPLLMLALIGALSLLLRRRSLIVLAPLAGLGAFSLIAGSRFAIYAVPVVALGLGFAVQLFGDRLSHAIPRLRTPLVVAAAVACLVPVVRFDWNSVPVTALIAPEVEALKALDRVATVDDATVAWWDYGYPILYFGKTRVLADGGRHDEDSGLVAEILLSDSQQASARLARLAAEVQQQLVDTDWGIAPTLFLNFRERGVGAAELLRSLAAVEEPPGIPAASRDTYLYLPARMLTLLTTIGQLRPLTEGGQRQQGIYRLWQGAKAEGVGLRLSPDVYVDLDSVTLQEAAGDTPLKAIYAVAGSGESLQVRTRRRNPEATTSGIYLFDHGIFIELDDDYLNSTAIQLLVFERADDRFYEPVFISVAAKIFRARR